MEDTNNNAAPITTVQPEQPVAEQPTPEQALISAFAGFRTMLASVGQHRSAAESAQAVVTDVERDLTAAEANAAVADVNLGSSVDEAKVASGSLRRALVDWETSVA